MITGGRIDPWINGTESGTQKEIFTTMQTDY